MAERIKPPDAAALCLPHLGNLADPGEESDPNEQTRGIL
jgi:hypothetical protein